MMSEARRRSTRRGKKRSNSIYSLNDLVQIPHNSTNLVGRLACKLMESPSVRWLVSFDDIPTRKDEEIAEEALGPIIGNVEDINKRKEDSGQLSERGGVEKQRSINVVQKETIQKSGIPVPSKLIQASSTDREQRSRRRRASSYDDTSSPHSVTSTVDAIGATGKKNVSVTGTFAGIPVKNKRVIPSICNKIHSKADNASTGDYAFRNKKTKVSSTVKSSKPRFQGKKKVLKVQLKTGTLYLSKEKVVWTFTR